jgi:hypothetical protein
VLFFQVLESDTVFFDGCLHISNVDDDIGGDPKRGEE